MFGSGDFHDLHGDWGKLLIQLSIDFPQLIDQVKENTGLFWYPVHTIDSLGFLEQRLNYFLLLHVLKLDRHVLIREERSLQHRPNFTLVLL